MRVGNAISRLTLLRGLLLLSLFGVPGIVQFDTSGITQKFGLFNLQSFSRMTLYLSIGTIVGLFLIGIEKLKFKKQVILNYRGPIFFYILTTLTSILVLKGGDILLSGYFIFEWMTFILLFYLYVKEKGVYLLPDLLNDIVLLIWLKILTLFLIIPIIPTLGIFFDPILGVMRLGGFFVGPNVLATLSALLASYYYFYDEGPTVKKYAIFGLAVLIIFATNSRGALFSFIVAFSFSLIQSRKGLNHLILFYFGGFILAIFITYIDYIMRGLDFTNLITLSERVPLWGKYAMEFPNSPIIGFGFIAGVKKLGLIIPKIHWIAPHAHNDFVQSLMSGGLLMGLFTFGVYFSLFRKCYSSALKGPSKLLMRNWFIILMGYAMLTPVINWKLFAVSGIFWMLFITLSIHNENPIRS